LSYRCKRWLHHRGSAAYLSRVFIMIPQTIDWEAQWSLFAPGFKDGLAHIDLENGHVLKLKPGGGFGDLSHPTTKLMLDLMKLYVKNKFIIDIGSGSGILTLAALLLGAQKGHGIDIEDEAISHAKENALLNNLEKKCVFTRPEKLKKGKEEPLILMNMITIEQKQAWKAFSSLGKVKEGIIITSGVLNTQKEEYLQLTTSWGWKLIHVAEEGEWLGFVFALFY